MGFKVEFHLFHWFGTQYLGASSKCGKNPRLLARPKRPTSLDLDRYA